MSKIIIAIDFAFQRLPFLIGELEIQATCDFEEKTVFQSRRQSAHSPREKRSDYKQSTVIIDRKKPNNSDSKNRMIPKKKVVEKPKKVAVTGVEKTPDPDENQPESTEDNGFILFN